MREEEDPFGGETWSEVQRLAGSRVRCGCCTNGMKAHTAAAAAVQISKCCAP
jgi:hypothetical protein